LLASFKDGVSPEKIEELIKGYANLVNLIEPMKAFHWLVNLDSELLPSVRHMLEIRKTLPSTQYDYVKLSNLGKFMTFLVLI